MRRLAPAGLLLATSLILGCLGPVDVVPQAAGITLGLVGWALGARVRSWLPVLIVAPLLLHAQSVETRLALVVCAGLATPGAAGRACALFAASALAWRMLLQGVPWIWSGEVALSRLLSHSLGLLTDQRIDFGPSASGLDLLVLYLLYVLAARSTGARSSLPRASLAIATFSLFVVLLPALGRTPTGVPFDTLGLFNMAHEHLAPSPQTVARVMFGWLVALLAALCALLPVAGDRRREGGRARALAATAISLLTLGTLVAANDPGGDRRPGEVVLLKTPAIDMNVPMAGRFGSARAGMLGLLSRYLELDGHRMRVHEGAVTAEAMAGASVVIAALPVVSYRMEERRALEGFVAQGGSLLVLGDHTDLLGTMGPLNELIAPWGMRIQFDSAFASVREWRGCLDGARPGLRKETGIGTGASLRIRGGIRPIVVGRYGLADAGDSSNTGRGASLGNYSYDAGEQLGDVVLAAGRGFGRGRVVVFGDTSSFQNLVLPYSYPFVASLFDDLARPAGRAREPASIGSGLAAAILGALALSGSALAAGGLAAAVLAGTLWIGLSGQPPPLDRLPADAKVALVDAAHLNDYARELWREESIGGLIVSLERDGYLPLIVDEGFDIRPIGAAALPVVLAPRRPLSRCETRALAAHIEQGGEVLVAAGAEQARAVRPLLSLYGLSIGDLPLGPVPILPDMDLAAFEAQRKLPQFRRAFPIGSAGAVAVSSRYRAFDLDVAVEARSHDGSGRLLVIADPDFLTDRVLENEEGAWEGNVDLLRRLLAGEDGA